MGALLTWWCLIRAALENLEMEVPGSDLGPFGMELLSLSNSPSHCVMLMVLIKDPLSSLTGNGSLGFGAVIFPTPIHLRIFSRRC